MKTLFIITTLALSAQILHARSNAFASHESEPDIRIVDSGTHKEIGIALEVGFDTQYNFNGINYGRDLTWSQADYEVPLTDSLFLGLGVWYGEILGEQRDDFRRELDYSVALTHEFSDASALSLVFTHYTYFGAIPNEPELGLEFTKSFGHFDFSLWYSYDFETKGHYLEASVAREFIVNDWLSIVPSAELSYVKGYLVEETGFNHTALRVDFPISVNDNFTITPFIAAVFPIDALKAGGFDKNEVHGGVACQLKF